MRSPKTRQLTVSELSRLIIQDLSSRRLKAGDRYLTSEEARKHFAVQKGLINQSMRELADRNVLVRQRRAGTFVGAGFSPELADASAVLRTVHILMAMDYHRAGVVPAERFVDGIGRILAGATVQIHFVHGAAAAEHARQVVEAAQARHSEGVVLIRAPREVQLLVERSGLQAVVFGSVYPDVKLSSVDVDQAGAAWLAVQYAVNRGRRKFLLVMKDQWRQGDNLLLRGATRELARCGVGLDSVEIASVPPHQRVVVEELRRRLHAHESLAVLCRGTFFARSVVEELRAQGLADAVDVVNLQGALEERHCCPTVVPEWTYDEQVAALAADLREIAEGRTSARALRVPVSLVDERGRALLAPPSVDDASDQLADGHICL